MTVARRIGALAALALAASTVAGCGHQAGSAATPAASTGGVKAVAAMPPGPLVAVLDRPFGASPNTLRMLRLDGTEVASTPLRDSDEAVAVGGRRALIAGSGTIRALAEDGSVGAVENLPAEPADALVTNLVASADGRRWLWSSVRQDASGDVDSRVFLGADGAVPLLVTARTVAGRALVPVAWTAGGPVISDEEVGLGGYILFRRGFGDTLLVDTAHSTLRPLSTQACALNDYGASGALVCVSGGHEAPHGHEAVTLHVTRPGAASITVALPGTIAQAGAALLNPGGDRVTLASSPATGATPEEVDAEVIDLARGTSKSLPAGLVPVAWTPAGGILATRHDGVVGGDPGTYLIAADGSVTHVSGAADAVGLGG